MPARRARHLLGQSLLGWLALWFAVLLPAHPRGAVTLPDRPGRAPAIAHACCASGTSGKSAPGKHNSPTDRASRCAVCHFVALLTTVTPPDQFDARPVPIHVAAPPAAARPAGPRISLAYDGRAPPAPAVA